MILFEQFNSNVEIIMTNAHYPRLANVPFFYKILNGGGLTPIHHIRLESFEGINKRYFKLWIIL